VLCALGEAQALLLAKVQSMRLEHISLDFSEVVTTQESSEAPIAAFIEVPAVPPVLTETSVMLETPRDNAADKVESSSALPPSPNWSVPSIASVDSCAIGEPTFTGDDSICKGTDTSNHILISAEPAPAETSPPGESVAADLAEITLRPSPVEARHTDSTGAEWKNRNYNFFDELDAQLAGLGDAGSAGDLEESIERDDQT
jgi:hypothetical protein